MKFLLALAIVAALGFVYFRWVRPYLKSLPQFAEVWQQEDTARAAVRVWFEGRKTLLAGIWGSVVAWAPDLLQIISGVDLKAAFHLPDNWALIVGAVVVPVLMLIFRTKAKPEV